MAAASWGTIPNWATLIALLAFGLMLIRGGAGQAVEGLQATNRELQRQISVLQEKVHELTKENAELRGRTDVAIALTPIIDWSTQHETRAQDRHDKTMVVLDLIAQRLGKEHDR